MFRFAGVAKITSITHSVIKKDDEEVPLVTVTLTSMVGCQDAAGMLGCPDVLESGDMIRDIFWIDGIPKMPDLSDLSTDTVIATTAIVIGEEPLRAVDDKRFYSGGKFKAKSLTPGPSVGAFLAKFQIQIAEMDSDLLAELSDTLKQEIAINIREIEEAQSDLFDADMEKAKEDFNDPIDDDFDQFVEGQLSSEAQHLTEGEDNV